MRGLALIFVVVGACAVTLTACTGQGEAWVSTPTVPSTTSTSSMLWSPPLGAIMISLPVSDWSPVNSSRFALSTQGVLVADGDCIRLREDHASGITTPVWPAGHTAYKIDGQIIVIDPQGYPVARTGDRVDYVGGYISAVHPDACTKGTDTFEIQEDIRLGY